MRSGTPALPKAGIAACTALLAALLPWRGAAAATLVVPTDYASIQDAIDAASPLDEVIVEPGVYTENIFLRSEIDVRGRETARTFLEPENADDPAVTVATVSDVQFSNVTLFNASIAMDIALSDGILVANVVFDTSDTALLIDLNSTVEVANNVFFGNGTAIFRDAVDVDVTSNIFASNDETLATVNPLVNLDDNVAANCWFDNADLASGGADGSYGTDAVIGDPLFADIDVYDFHLQEGSPCIDAGLGTDVVDGTDGDAGAYGGDEADVFPFPVDVPVLTDASTDMPEAVSVLVEWPANLAYLVTHSTNPGGYRVYYDRDAPGPPYEGTDAGGGTEPSPIDVGDVTSYTLSDLMPAAAAPGTAQLLSAEGRNGAVALTWQPVAGANGYRVHYGVAATDENQVDVGDVAAYNVSGLTNGTEYRFAVSALARSTYYVAVTAVDSTSAEHESVLSEEASIDLGGGSAGPLSNELTALPEFVQAYPVLPEDGECFIATAAYGADWHAEVQILRDFRDRYLVTSTPGRWLVGQYYAHSPPIAEALRGHDGWRAGVRWMLTPFVAAAVFLLGSSATIKSVAGALIAALVVLVAWRRRTARTARTGGLGPSVLCLATAACLAQLIAPPRASAQPRRNVIDSPRWTYELYAGELRPDLDQFETFYGDTKETYYGVGGSYRFFDWLELGAQWGRMKATGTGLLTSSQELGGRVEYRLNSFQVYTNFVFQRGQRQRVVPYVGVGIVAARYDQAVDEQPDIDGWTDVGASARAGVRFRLASHGPITAPTTGSPYWRSFVFLEAQETTAEVDEVDLGGTAYVLGFRMEFDFTR